MTVEEAEKELERAAAKAAAADLDEGRTHAALAESRIAHSRSLEGQMIAYDEYRTAVQDWQRAKGYPVTGAIE